MLTSSSFPRGAKSYFDELMYFPLRKSACLQAGTAGIMVDII